MTPEDKAALERVMELMSNHRARRIRERKRDFMMAGLGPDVAEWLAQDEQARIDRNVTFFEDVAEEDRC